MKDDSQKMLKDYTKLVEIMENSNNTDVISVDHIFGQITKLYDLKHYGEKIREMKENSEKGRDEALKNEIIFDPN